MTAPFSFAFDGFGATATEIFKGSDAASAFCLRSGALFGISVLGDNEFHLPDFARFLPQRNLAVNLIHRTRLATDGSGCSARHYLPLVDAFSAPTTPATSISSATSPPAFPAVVSAFTTSDSSNF